MSAQNRNIGLLEGMGEFLQSVAGLPETADGTRFLATGALARAREMSSDAFFAGDATPEARLVTELGAFIDRLDDLPMTRSGAQGVPRAMAAQAARLAASAQSAIRAARH